MHGLLYAARLLHRHREWLLAEDLLAGLEGLDRQVGVRVMRGADQHRVDTVVRQYPVEVGREVVGLGLLGALPGGVFDDVHGRREPQLRRCEDVGQVMTADAAAADKPDP